ncbi:MAG TPA: histidine phosphatase family protein [Azospirillaceae bacterium]|nr:histidine phosphatase family protein [Azospirillaceae bacterium]
MTLVTRWWLIRHAPVINPGGKIYGQRDVEADTTTDPLPYQGLAAGLPADAVWLCTHLRRTRQTAQAVFRARGGIPPELIIEEDLVEQSFGDWQGMDHDEVRATQPKEATLFWLAPATVRPPGGESFAEVVARVSDAMLRRSAEHAGHDIVAVIHGGSIRAALALALGLDPEMALGFKVDNCSLTRLDHIALEGRPAAWRIAGVNLPGPAATMAG